MIGKKIKTNFLGVRYREHPTRRISKDAVGKDRCFFIRYKIDGKDREEVIGWASEKIDAEKAFGYLSTIRQNIKNGSGPMSLAEIREENERQSAALQEEASDKEKAEVTFSDFWKTVYLPAAETTKTPRSLETERGYYKKWLKPILGNIPLRKIDAIKIENVMLRAQKAGKSPGTINKILGVISQVWNRAVAHGVVQGDSPTRKLKKPQQDNRRMRFLSKEQARDLLAALKPRSQDMHDEALLSLLCGLRAGEIHSLTWGDIDLKNGTIFIRDPKNKRNRHSFISEDVEVMLKNRYREQSTTDLIFPTYSGKQRMYVPDTFARTVDDLGLNNTGEIIKNAKGDLVPVRITDARQKVVFHSLRHTFASWLAQQGTPLYTVAELMGHSTLEMTRRYSHLAPDTLRKAALSLQGHL